MPRLRGFRLNGHHADAVGQLCRAGKDHATGAALGSCLPGDVRGFLPVVDVLRNRRL
jgi:hypothetical protein